MSDFGDQMGPFIFAVVMIGLAIVTLAIFAAFWIGWWIHG